MIDMAMLIAEIKPDADGNVIPPSVKEGSADFASANGRHEQITLVIAAGIYNVTTATCGGGCITCCGYSSFQISPSPILCPIGDSMSCSALATDCNGYSSNLGATWSSSNTSVMMVNSSGVVTGVAVGSATSTANFGSVPVYSGQYCGPNSCPAGSPAPSTGATVQVPTSLFVTSTNIISMNNYCPDPSYTYGILLAITYQVLDQNNTDMASTAMEPQEEVTNLIVNGVQRPDPVPQWADIGPSFYPGTSQFTNANGQFVDAPLGICAIASFTDTFTQPISVLLSGQKYSLVTGNVRVNYWSLQSTSSGHGSITNNNDVSRSH